VAEPGRLRGRIALEIACDGTITGQARGQTEAQPRFTATYFGSGGQRVTRASLDVVAELALAGRLAAGSGVAQPARVDGMLDGATMEPPRDDDTFPVVTLFQRAYATQAPSRWDLLAGDPDHLQGTWDGTADLAVPALPDQPALQVRSAGRWLVSRVAVELCAWQGVATVHGAFGNEQRHDETLELVFWPSGDGRVHGEAHGVATVSGGSPGGCEYSGGGAFVARVGGEQVAGRFRLWLEDDDQPQLLVTVTCPSGRYIAPHAALSTAFASIEIAEASGAEARLDNPRPGTATRGTLTLNVRPAAGASPP